MVLGLLIINNREEGPAVLTLFAFIIIIVVIIIIVIIIIIIIIIITIIIFVSKFNKTFDDAAVKQSNQWFHHKRQHPGFSQWDGHSSPTRVLPLVYRKVSARMTSTMYNLLSGCSERRR